MDGPPQPGAGPESTGNNNEEHERLRDEGPRIYVASLADYNAGILHGEWIDADQDPDELQSEINGMLRTSATEGAEEFAIHDYEGFGHYQVDEYDSLDWISRIALGMSAHGPAFAAWAEHCDQDREALQRFEDAYLGDWSSLQDYAEEVLEDLGYLRAIEEAVPDMLQPYVHVDIEAFARDLEHSGDVIPVEHERGVWVFDERL